MRSNEQAQGDLENPLLFSDEESKDPLNSPQLNGLVPANLPNLLQQKYGNSSKIKWVFNNMLKMSFSPDTLFSVFSQSIPLNEETHTKEELLNLAIDTYLAREFDSDQSSSSQQSDNDLLLDSRRMKINRPTPWVHKGVNNEKKDGFLCGICYSHCPENERTVMPNCGHSFCQRCVFEHLKTLILTGRVAKMPCPGNECKNILTDIEIKDFLKEDEELLRKFEKFKRDLEVSMDPKHRWCIRPGCEYLVEGDINHPRAECKCGQVMCFNCMNQWHEGRDCETAIDMEYRRYAEKGRVKNCPKCNTRIEKNEGCNHMHCTRCKFDFCWLCNREYKPGHYEWYNLLGCPLMMYTRLNNSKFHSTILCLKKTALIFGLMLGIIIVAGLIAGLLPLVFVVFGMSVPVLFYIKICEPKKDCKGIFIGVLIFIFGLPLIPFILLLMIAPGLCILMCCRNQFDEIYL